MGSGRSLLPLSMRLMMSNELQNGHFAFSHSFLAPLLYELIEI
jgi:hypothetical protein